MFCPNCAANNKTEQKFCRSCGMNLESSAESLIEQFPTAESQSTTERTPNIERFGQFALGGLALALLCGIVAVIYMILTKMVLSGLQPVAGVLLIIFVIFAALSLVYVALSTDKKTKKEKFPARAIANGPVSTGKLLDEQHIEPVGSVIEKTTKRLVRR